MIQLGRLLLGFMINKVIKIRKVKKVSKGSKVVKYLKYEVKKNKVVIGSHTDCKFSAIGSRTYCKQCGNW